MLFFGKSETGIRTRVPERAETKAYPGRIAMFWKSALAFVVVITWSLSGSNPVLAQSKAEAFCKKRYGDGGVSYAKCVQKYEANRAAEQASGKSKK
jgi:hypothetical protein